MLLSLWASLVAQMIKNLLAVQQTQVQSLDWEDLLEKGMAPTLVFLTEEFHGQRSLLGYSPWGHRESDTIEQLTLSIWHKSTSLYGNLESVVYAKNMLYFINVSVQFSRSVVSDSLRPHESQHAKPPCPSPTPGVHSHSRPSSQ